MKAKLELARALSSHSNPRGELEILFERALDAYLEQLQKRRFGKSTRTRSEEQSDASRVVEGLDAPLQDASQRIEGRSPQPRPMAANHPRPCRVASAGSTSRSGAGEEIGIGANAFRTRPVERWQNETESVVASWVATGSTAMSEGFCSSITDASGLATETRGPRI